MKTNGKPEAVGKRLKRLRLAAGLSQRELSEPGVSYAYISRIEAGARNPSVKALRMLAEKLDVTVEYLETGRDGGTADELVAELFALTGSHAVSARILPGGRTQVGWSREGKRRRRGGESLTAALLAAVRHEREVEAVRVEQTRLAKREEELSR